MKFYKTTGPAFNPGEEWVGASGASDARVRIVSVRKHPCATTDHTSDYGVTYEWVEHGVIVQHEKDAWSFQVRYTHVADLEL
jgi:hypothetical protein